MHYSRQTGRERESERMNAIANRPFHFSGEYLFNERIDRCVASRGRMESTARCLVLFTYFRPPPGLVRSRLLGCCPGRSRRAQGEQKWRSTAGDGDGRMPRPSLLIKRTHVSLTSYTRAFGPFIAAQNAIRARRTLFWSIR